MLALRGLLDEPSITFEDVEAVRAAADMFQDSSCGFADCLVAAKNARLGAEFTATFDRRMVRLAGVRVI